MSERKLLRNFLYDNRIIFILSVIFAIIFWVFVALKYSPEEVRIVSDVPVIIELENSVPSQFGLEIFGKSDFSVNVTVVGKRYQVSTNALSADDFIAIAQTSYVDSAGKHTLQIKVASRNDNDDYEIVGFEDENIEVYFDTYSEGEYTLVADIEGENYLPNGYAEQESILSNNKVMIGGPTREIAKIDRVVARVSVNETLTQTTTFKSEIIPMNEYGGTLRYLTIDADGIDITVTLPILKVVDVKPVISFKNAPADYLITPLLYTCTPTKVKLGIPEASIDDSGEFNIGTIDFSELLPGKNTFVIYSSDITGGVVIGDIKEFEVIVKIPNVDIETMSIDAQDIRVSNIPSNYNLKVTQIGKIKVKVIGTKQNFDKIDLSDISASIVEPGKLESGIQNAEMRLHLNSSDSAWISGVYNVKINAVEKEITE
ncbi:MAG TPA: hypothetical protein VFD52_06560 [Clostridia bacterium]|nr:hypothetical protein [Clostridia bacterium]